MNKLKNPLLLVLFTFTFLLWGCGKDEPTRQNPPEVVIPDDDESLFATTNWVTTNLSDDIVWKHYHFDNLFSSKQYISVLDIDQSSKKVKVDFQYVKSGFLKTSDAGINSRGTAAINGGFFNTTVGGSTVFFKKEGEIINKTRSGFDEFRENAGLAITKGGEVYITPRPPSPGWESANVYSLLASGPLLLQDGNFSPQTSKVFNEERHPRTAIGITDSKHIIAVVVDGRTSESAGLTMKELSIVMKDLGCVNAMNLDGGGSSTMWIKNRGVVNHPSDNKKFDHQGERGVATVVCFVENL